MKTLFLNGTWTLHENGKSRTWPATVPGCVHLDLQRAGVIGNIFWKDEEPAQEWVGERDWTYRREFSVSTDLLKSDALFLVCDGLDTLAEVRINGRTVMTTDNMYRVWRAEVGNILKSGTNRIEVRFRSPIPIMIKRQAERKIPVWNVYSPKYAGKSYIRKMPCSFGWDWGPRGATQGIWKSIRIIGIQSAEISDLQVRQTHFKHKVDLALHVDLLRTNRQPVNVEAVIRLDRQVVAQSRTENAKKQTDLKLAIRNPRLWWPNGLGDQPLYELTVSVLDKAGKTLDKSTRRLGLRELKLIREKDKIGESFLFEVNGRRFFVKGANWIPSDIFLPRLTRQTYERLLGDAAECHMNMIRVWGGGFYEMDDFYDVADELGILIWQDFMFACSTYPTFDPAFMSNVKQEATDNIRRLRHHACLAFWVGNNEIEQGLVADRWTDRTMSWEDYKPLFDKLLPRLVRKLDPDRPYWPASPHTPGKLRKDFNNQNYGDAHLWSVWFHNKPFEEQRRWTCRFMSEFGFQSFPEPRTIQAFTDPEDRNLTSYVMDLHQRSGPGNKTILAYILDWFKMPKNLDEWIWMSQVSQGLCIQYAVEHLRRIQPHNMGVMYWQINDIWPCASWSSIDVFGRWKALQYMARRFFAPVAVSILENSKAGTMAVHASNQKPGASRLKVAWRLTTCDGRELLRGEKAVRIPSQTQQRVCAVDCRPFLKKQGDRNLLFWTSLKDEDTGDVSSSVNSFQKPKHLLLKPPRIRTSLASLSGNRFKLQLQSDKPALWVRLEIKGMDARFSDNFFHLDGRQSRTITIRPRKPATLYRLRKDLRITPLTATC